MLQVHGSLNCPGVEQLHGVHAHVDFDVSTYPRVKDNIGFLTFLLLEFG